MTGAMDTPLLIQSLGNYYKPVDAQQGPVSLKTIMAAECPTRFRRIDRYTQLALLGANRCVAGQTLDSRTGLYIGSRFAALSNTVTVHQQMVAEGCIPKPAHFINTLSNSAGYYVARHLNLGGRNLFVSREDASLIAALQLASLDLAGKVVTQALVGVVDESAMPVDDQCRRLGVPSGTTLGEGSHWFLVTRDDTGAGPQVMQPGLSRLASLADEQALEDWVAGCGSGGVTPRVWWPEQCRALPAAVAGLVRFEAGLACYPAAIGGAISRYLETGCRQPLLVLAPDGVQRYHGLLLQPPA